MRQSPSSARFALFLAAAGTVFPAQVFAAPPAFSTPSAGEPANATTSARAVIDVRINDGAVSGRLVNSSGQPVDGAPVTAEQDGRVIASTVTTRDGLYRLSVTNGGLYTLVGGGQRQLVRAWAPAVAPPAARDQAVLLQAAAPVRGQGFGGNGTLLGLTALGTAAILGGIALSRANDAEDDADDNNAAIGEIRDILARDPDTSLTDQNTLANLPGQPISP